jgi:hypothetical protein
VPTQLEPLCDIGTHVPDRRVGRVIARPGVNAPPGDLEVEHPAGQVDAAAGIHAKVANQVLLRLALVARPFQDR